MSKRLRPKIITIVGPTASGKSELAVFLARKLGGEIISADSRQIYRDLNIGTAKVPGSWRITYSPKPVTQNDKSKFKPKKIFFYKGISHHCIDIIDPKRQYSAAEFKKCADAAIEGIVSQKNIPIIAGGTGHWVDAVVFGTYLPDVPPDTLLREKLRGKTCKELFLMLKKLDPARARSIDPKNPRRLIRAIEIARALGKVPQRMPQQKYTALWIGVSVPKEKLREKIRARLHERINNDMVGEAKKLHRQGLSWKRMRELGLEYRYLADFLQKKLSKKEFAEELEKSINDYAKRQMTWFRKNKSIRWISNRMEAEKLATEFLKKAD